jgi:hypothetical protein
MTRIKLPYIKRQRDRHRRDLWRHYFRRPGYPSATLPGLPGSAEFMRAYETAMAGRPSPIGAARTTPGSMAALAVDWMQSPVFGLNRGEAYQRVVRRALDRFLAEHGHKPMRNSAPGTSGTCSTTAPPRRTRRTGSWPSCGR